MGGARRLGITLLVEAGHHVDQQAENEQRDQRDDDGDVGMEGADLIHDRRGAGLEANLPWRRLAFLGIGRPAQDETCRRANGHLEFDRKSPCLPLPEASSFACRDTPSGAAANDNSRRGRTKLRPRRLIEARAARKFNSDKERRPQRRFAAPALTYVMRLAALFRCSNHKGNRLATLMIQGARAAYARLRHKVSPPNDFRPRSRRNLAPILGDGDFQCCASPPHGASAHNLVWPGAVRRCICACAGRISLNG